MNRGGSPIVSRVATVTALLSFALTSFLLSLLSGADSLSGYEPGEDSCDSRKHRKHDLDLTLFDCVEDVQDNNRNKPNSGASKDKRESFYNP